MSANVEYWRSVAESRKTTYHLGLGVAATSLIAIIIVCVWACMAKNKALQQRQRYNSNRSTRSTTNS